MSIHVGLLTKTTIPPTTCSSTETRTSFSACLRIRFLGCRLCMANRRRASTDCRIWPGSAGLTQCSRMLPCFCHGSRPVPFLLFGCVSPQSKILKRRRTINHQHVYVYGVVLYGNPVCFLGDIPRGAVPGCTRESVIDVAGNQERTGSAMSAPCSCTATTIIAVSVQAFAVGTRQG